MLHNLDPDPHSQYRSWLEWRTGKWMDIHTHPNLVPDPENTKLVINLWHGMDINRWINNEFRYCSSYTVSASAVLLSVSAVWSRTLPYLPGFSKSFSFSLCCSVLDTAQLTQLLSFSFCCSVAISAFSFSFCSAYTIVQNLWALLFSSSFFCKISDTALRTQLS